MCGRILLSVSSPPVPGSGTDLYFTGFVPFDGHSPLVFVESTGLLAASGTQIVVPVSANALLAVNSSKLIASPAARPRPPRALNALITPPPCSLGSGEPAAHSPRG